jgi:hypothetical protein
VAQPAWVQPSPRSRHRRRENRRIAASAARRSPLGQTISSCLLIALDVWVLGICTSWNIREAFLPPVTIEELDALRGTPNEPSSDLTPGNASNKATVERVAGTRGWYDNTSEAVNFVVPASVALMFVAIEMIVLMTVSLQ